MTGRLLQWLPRRRPRGARRSHPLRTGVLVIAAAVISLYLTVAGDVPLIGGDDGRTVTAEFAAANEVDDETPVRVDGVQVGRVDSVDVEPGRNTGMVAMRITEDDLHIGSDARAEVVWRTILGGNMAIDLEPGSPSAPPLEGPIPLRRTRMQTEFDQLLQVYDGPTAVAQRDMLRGLSGGLSGGSAGRLVDVLGPALRPVAPALRGLRGRRRDDLQALVRDTATTLRALDRPSPALGELVSGGQRTFRTLADARVELGATLERAAGAMDAAVSGAHAIDTTLPALDRIVAELRPGARRLAPAVAAARPTLTELSRVLRSARPLLEHLRPAVRDLDRASRAGRGVIAGLQPTVRRLDTELLPWLARADEDSKRPTYQMLGPTAASLAAAAAGFDDVSHLLNFPVLVGENPATFVPCRTMFADASEEEKLRCSQIGEVIAQLLRGGGPE